MSRYFIIFALIGLLTGQKVYCQVYGNEWIVPGQSYYKIPVGKTGVYSLSYQDLTGAGIPVNALNPHNLQIWRRGKEQAILVQGEDDGAFDASDLLLFYGRTNDGAADSVLYGKDNGISIQPHQYYSLYTDTASYFLTWGGPGKRMPVSNITSANTPDAYHLSEALTLYTDTYDKGAEHLTETYTSFYDVGEGWFGPLYGGARTFTIKTPGFIAAGNDATLELMVVGRNDGDHQVHVILGSPSSPALTIDLPTITDHGIYKLSTAVPMSAFTGSDLSVTVKSTASSIDYISLAYIKLKYPQKTDMGGKNEYFLYPATNPSDTAVLAVSNVPGAVAVFDVSTPDSPSLVLGSQLGTDLTLAIPGVSAGNKVLYAINPASYLQATITDADLNNYPVNASYLIVTHKRLLTSVNAYASYRSSTAGGGYKTVVAEISKLYNLFSYGDKSPLAIRRFCKYMIDNGSPEYLFLIGKGLEPSLAMNGVYYRKNPVYYQQTPDPTFLRYIDDLVPTAGMPGSDILYTLGLGLSGVGVDLVSKVPALATGRLAALSNKEVDAYLDKVQSHESLDSNKLWRKHLIHLSGGQNAAEMSEFKEYVNAKKIVVEGPLFGGKVVKTFSKDNSNSVDDSFRLSVADEVNKGVSYMTFLGHSSPAFTDVDLGFVSNPAYNFNNEGKYPALMMNGCSSGNIFRYYSFSEDWILTPKKGAIITLGQSDVGYPFLLEGYTDLFYDSAFTNRNLLTQPIGKIQQAMLKAYAAEYYDAWDSAGSATVHQMTLHGDPAVKIYTPSKPDLSINEGQDDKQVYVYSYDGKPVTAVSDSFALAVVVSNFGTVSDKDSITITVDRMINNKLYESYGPFTYRPVYYKDTIYITIKSRDPLTYGSNVFTVKADALDSIPEMRENNNVAVLDHFIPLSGIAPVFPKNFSIVNHKYLGTSDSITLVAQSNNLLLTHNDYYFELDTTYRFNSSMLRTGTVTAGALVKWQTQLLPGQPDSVVYYWRVRYNDIQQGQDTLWGSSSFIYIGGSPEGWSQTRYPQFESDALSNMSLDIPKHRYDFDSVSAQVYVKTYGTGVQIPSYRNPATWNIGFENVLKINETPLMFDGYGSCSHGIVVMTLNKYTALPYLETGSNTGGSCGRNLRVLKSYYTPNSAPQTQLINVLDSIDDGNYVVIMSHGNAGFDSWSAALKTRFKTALGSRLVDSLKTGYPFILLARKGNYPLNGTGPAPIFEKYKTDITTFIELDTTFSGKYYQGTITTPLIGPASGWGTLYRDVKAPETSDAYSLYVEKVKLDGTSERVLLPSFGTSLDLSSIVDSAQYPYIRLVASVKDSVMLTPPSLEKWQVVYSGVPEGSMNPAATQNLTQYNSFTKIEGDSAKLSFVFDNISALDFRDSVKVVFSVTNQNGKYKRDTVNIGKLLKGQSKTFQYSIRTYGFEGKNSFRAFVNPRLQPEEYYENNILEVPFTVQGDKTNPILDVTFDGQHIMNGDIVSPNPLISLILNDENQVLIKNDTLGMEVFLQRPGKGVPEKLSMGSDWGQMAGKSNSFRVDLHPKELTDGTYKLIAQGTDVKGNKAGSQRYEINFEVVNTSSISNFYPYPNPFSTSTRFVFTITGNEVPEDLKIQIMTVTGKVVREITKSELGPLHIGNNKTEYAWDGTDEFGDKLANGVYLYRVVIKNSGDFQHRDTAGDKAFKKNIGKLYILR